MIQGSQRSFPGRQLLGALAICIAAVACSAVGPPSAAGPQSASDPDGLIHTEYGYEVAPPDVPTRKGTPFERMEGYFPNTELTTHDGRTVRFYDDLIVGKVVLINFMYTQCTGI